MSRNTHRGFEYDAERQGDLETGKLLEEGAEAEAGEGLDPVIKAELDEILAETNKTVENEAPEPEIEAPAAPIEVKVVPATMEQQKATQKFIRELRKADRAFNKTCAVCAIRVPLSKIGGGKSEVCDDCK